MTGTAHPHAFARARGDGQPVLDDQVIARARRPRNVTTRIFRWLPVAIIPITGLVVFAQLNTPISDPDTFWHLRLGKHLQDSWRFVGSEPWSSFADRPLVLHEWSPELVYVAVHHVAGWAGLSYLQAFGALALLVTLYVCTRQFSAPLVASLTAIAALAGASDSVALRPQVISFILLAVFTTAWLRTFDDGRARWWLIPLAWVWACSHGMWFVGVGVGAAVVLGMLVDRRLSWRAASRLAAIPVGGLLAAALTPVGTQLLASPVGMRGYTRFISEWRTPSPFMLQVMITLGIAIALVVIWTRTRTRPFWTDLILMGIGVVCTLAYARTIALGAIILALLAARALNGVVPVGADRQLEKGKEVAVVGLGVALVCLVGAWTSRVDVSQPADVPFAFNSILDALPADAVVFNEYELGGWLLWEHPSLDPVIDGRADVYTVAHFDEIAGAYDLLPGWEATVRDSGASAAVLKEGTSLPEALARYLGWRRVSSDEGYVLLMPPGRERPGGAGSPATLLTPP